MKNKTIKMAVVVATVFMLFQGGKAFAADRAKDLVLNLSDAVTGTTSDFKKIEITVPDAMQEKTQQINVYAGAFSTSKFCPNNSRFVHRETISQSSSYRIALNSAPDVFQLSLYCYCCGKDENGHCNKQCCDP